MLGMRTATVSELSPGERVLVVGAEGGDVSLSAARRLCRVTATDLVPELLELLERRAALEHLPLTVRVADPTDLPFPDESFDVVIANAGATSVSDPQRVARELRRVCKPQGKEIHMHVHASAQKGFDQPDEVREFPNGRAEILSIGGTEIGRFVFEPGWRWSNDVKPIAGTDSCEKQHFQYTVSGRLGIRMNDGTEMELGPGDVALIEPGHDGWVIGDEPAVILDWAGAATYAKPS
jgi:2-polyprenyl-3-methyl-5-hydroxy-6-metoxy-1,4-benzoquinol methylase